ncbi:hypothetical protein HPP92_019590 [Vanilla planifolia]|uniref:Uncharacterized protein n=1 Tax=Vanilla planifolia TaxID=51239 RepID=A0A835Q355_VANPL|nr:hypothetical protein HPP92_019590 [Vanilla planifolia]
MSTGKAASTKMSAEKVRVAPKVSQLTTPRSSGTVATAGNRETLPEWKLHCLCSEQSLLSPTIRGGLQGGGSWF